MRHAAKAAITKLSDMYHTARLLLDVHRAMRDGTVHRRRSTGVIITDPVEVAKALFADFKSVVIERRPKTKVEQLLTPCGAEKRRAAEREEV